MKKTVLAILGSLVVLAGCGKDPVQTDEENIQDLIIASPEASFGNLNGQEGSSGSRDVEIPQCWYRQLTAISQYSVVFENDPAVGVCTLTVDLPLVAVLNIDVVHDDTLLFGQKDIDVVRTRRLVVEKTGDASSPYGGWVLTHVSPVEFMMAASDTQEVFVSAMRLYLEDSLVFECTDPGTFYDVETDLPTISEGDLVRLEAEVTHSAPSYTPPLFVYAHGPLPTWPRHVMNDDGELGDQSAGDGIYTYEWLAEYSNEHPVFAVDVIDADTFADQEEEDYDSGAWTMPYHETD